MDANNIIQLLGIVYFTFGLAFVLNKKYYLNLFKALAKSKSYMFIWGYMSLVIWIVILFFFNSFALSKDWLVGIFGVLALLKWISIIMFPEFFQNFTKSFTKKKTFNAMSVSLIIMAIALLYLWYVA